MLSALEFTTRRYEIHPLEGQTWVAEASYGRQRPIREHHVEFLHHLMATGRFRAGSEIALAVLKGRRFIVNGNHTLYALVRLDRPIIVTLTEYHVTHEEEVDALYNTFDRQLPRTARDMLKAYGFADHAGINQRQSEVLFSAQRLLLSGFVYATARAHKTLGYLRDNELLYVSALEWTKEASMFCEDIRAAKKPWQAFLTRQALMAIALVQYRFAPAQAETFWQHVALENHVDPNHPTRLLARWFQTESHKQRYNAIDYAYITAMAWNAVALERSLRSFTMPSREVPITIEGTPYTRQTVLRYIDEQWHLLEQPVAYDEPYFRRYPRVAA